MMGNYLKKIVLFFVIFGFLSPLYSQTDNSIIRLFSKLEKDTILTGDQVTYKVVAESKKGVKVQMPSLSDSLENGIEMVGRPRIDSVANSAGVTYTLQFLVTAFDSGVHFVPSIPITYLYNGQVDSISTDSISLFVKTIPKNPKQTDIFDIKQPIREPLTFSEVAPWVGLSLIIIGIIVLLIIYLKKRKENKPFLNIFRPKEPPHVIALRELEKLRDEKIWASESHKQYYTQLIDIIRTYLEGRFGINAPEQTTSEILSELDKVDYNFGSLYAQLQDLLSSADLVKFAKHVPVLTENEQNLKFAFDFVNKTKPEEVESTTTDGNGNTQNPSLNSSDETLKMN